MMESEGDGGLEMGLEMVKWIRIGDFGNFWPCDLRLNTPYEMRLLQDSDGKISIWARPLK